MGQCLSSLELTARRFPSMLAVMFGFLVVANLLCARSFLGTAKAARPYVSTVM
jgi:hypothetical protein